MQKATKTTLFIVSFLVLTLVGAYFLGVTQFTAFDDFNTEDDFTIPQESKWTTDLVSRTCQAGGGSSKGYSGSATIQNGQYVLTSPYNDATSTVTYKTDLKQKDFKTRVTLQVNNPQFNSGSAIFTLSLGGVQIYTDSITSGNSKLGSSNSKDLLIEGIKDIENPDIYHINVNGEEVKQIEVKSDTALLSYTVNNQNAGTCPYPGSTALSIDYLKSRPYFNCYVDSDEVVIRDVFVEGSTFGYDDLTYPPVKFCVDSYPAIKRSFTEKGVKADIQGQLTKKIITNQQITVGEGESIEIYYIADYKEGMGLRCGLDLAYDTTAKKCVKIIAEAEDIVEIINNKEFITIQKNQYLFQDKLTFADAVLTSQKPVYLCANQEAKANAPDPENKCWESTISYDGKLLKFQANEEKSLNDYLSLKYIPEAQFKDKLVQDDYTNNFVLSYKDFLSINSIGDPKDDYYVVFGKDANVKFSIDNKLGDLSGAGVQVMKKTSLLFSETTEQKTIAIKEGKHDYSIPIDSNRLGIVSYQITPFFKIGNELFFDNEVITRNYEVVNQLPSPEVITNTEIKVIEKVINKPVFITSGQDTPTTDSSTTIPIVIFLIVVGAVLIIWKVYSKKQ